MALLAVGLLPTDIRGLRLGDVTPDGSSVTGPAGSLDVPVGARAYLRAQRTIRGFERARSDSLPLARRGHPLSAKTVAEEAWGTLIEASITVSSKELLRRRTPSEHRLAQRGLHIRRQPERHLELRKAPTCRRHGVPNDLEVEGSMLSHSKNICWISSRSRDVAREMRPARNGFELTVTRDCELGQVIGVRQHGKSHGELIAVSVGDDRIWFQRTGSAESRSLEVVRATIERDYPAALSR